MVISSAANSAKMPARIDTAKCAINSRIEKLTCSLHGAAERGAVMDALNALRFLTQELALLAGSQIEPRSGSVSQYIFSCG